MLPDAVKYSISHHHDEPGENTTLSANRHLAYSIYLGSLVGDIFYFGNKDNSIRKFMESCHILLGINNEDSDQFLHNIHPQLLEIASHFDIAIGSGNTYEEIICKLNEEIAAITITNEAVKSHLTRAFQRERELAAKLDDANRKLQVLASKDSLTGLYNRQFLNKILEKEWQQCVSNNNPLSVIMIDIDDFKQVNDNYGHKAGDVVLMKLTNTLSKNIRKTDFLARYGGEEFALVMPQTTLENACKLAGLLIEVVRNLEIPFVDKQLGLTISCGISTTSKTFDDTPEDLIQRADEALYAAKKSGKNRIAVKAQVARDRG